MIGKTDVMVAWARIMFGLWLLSTAILFLINYRAYLPPEINRHIEAPRSKLRGIFDRRE